MEKLSRRSLIKILKYLHPEPWALGEIREIIEAGGGNYNIVPYPDTFEKFARRSAARLKSESEERGA